jgi:predicted anti-sigma-YlaC factor YlaD
MPASTACELTRLRISVRLDGELSALDEASLARHLDRCDACDRFAHALAGLTEVLRSDCLPSTPGRPGLAL